jgi:methylenetetrahydrofolate reductase (NADPH)
LYCERWQIPKLFSDALEPHKNDDEKVRAIGTKLVADMCRRILKEDIGIRGLHFYTMNLEKATRMLLEELNLVPRVETIKPLPWRQVNIPLFLVFMARLSILSSTVPHSQ